MKKRTEAFLLLLNINFFIIFCLKNRKNLTFQIFWGENIIIHNVLRNFLMYVFRILFNNDPQQISINSARKWPRKWYRNMNFSFKKCIMEKTHLTFCYVYANNASITQEMRFLYYKWIHFGIMSYMYEKFDHLST